MLDKEKLIYDYIDTVRWLRKNTLPYTVELFHKDIDVFINPDTQQLYIKALEFKLFLNRYYTGKFDAFNLEVQVKLYYP